MLKPDYAGGSIVNLMSSIIQGRGGASDHPPLRGLPLGDIWAATNCILLVVDGLGADWLATRSPSGILSQHLKCSMHTVFPTTTASAITTFLTGDAPQQHGIVGWYTFLRELGTVMTILPGRPRYGGAGYTEAGLDPKRLLASRPLFDRIQSRSFVISPAEIVGSDFNQAHSGGAETIGFRKLDQMFSRATRIVRRNLGTWERQYIYMYWPKLDSIGHAEGMGSLTAHTHLGEIERAIERFVERIAGSDSLLIVTSDHGHLDSHAPDQIDIGDYPALVADLTLPLCGEPRAAVAYVRARRAQAFEDAVARDLGERVELHASEDLFSLGLFGLGEPHPRLMERIGDYIMLPTGRGTIRETLPFDKAFEQIGTHGGLSRAELHVPLSVFRC